MRGITCNKCPRPDSDYLHHLDTGAEISAFLSAEQNMTRTGHNLAIICCQATAYPQYTVYSHVQVVAEVWAAVCLVKSDHKLRLYPNSVRILTTFVLSLMKL